ncbi:MAG: citrate synthase [Gemmatimonadales bacterium]|jgi:citrate synthase|nr:citrate synthase [Gemmatimonadales bacterium]MDG2238861.1 citrate synthase [Longimicrobiales bacterium]MBT3499113.1 citrate synthase [Gemmatimonadales bacterium]MBT3774257.1 citrate synthase [Gemmatimonadales bacterium]MBT3959664.1 citrate synthase [Gemmatimonadales bacterium]
MSEDGDEGANTLSIRDNRTGKNYEVDIQSGDVIRAMDLRQIKVDESDFGMMSYDPGYTNTASTRSSVTYIDGGKGILRYRGYPIEQLAERSTHLEVSYLLLKGELPTQSELDSFVHEVTFHTYVHENITDLLSGFRYDAHAMSMVMSAVTALSTFYPEARDIEDPDVRWRQIIRLVAKMPTLAAYAYRHHRGLPFVYPENELSYTANLLNMLFRVGTREYKPSPVLERALDVLFILHADHEQNCSATAMRVIGSSHADPYSALGGAMGALYGPLHGGANEAVLRMLRRIGSVDNIPAFMEGVKNREERLMGFGHRVYKAYDPRASIIKRTADEVFEVTGRNPMLDIALELEKIALNEDFFVERNLYPNVDFYSGIIYQAMGFPVELFPVLFAIPRTVGWLAQWQEHLSDPEQRIARPRQIFTGSDERDFVSLDQRG